jgi:hypothetical protein
MILGFDASTTTCGWAFYDGTVITDAGFVDISKCPTNKEKALRVISVIDAHPHIHLTSQINLEAALSGFMGGRTSQQVIIKLARFNAVFEYIVAEHFKIPVNLVGATTARKYVFGKARIKGVDAKTFVKEHLSKKMDLTKFDKTNKIGTWDQKNADMYDSMVMAMFRL